MADYEKGMTYREIAKKHGVSFQSVHSTITRIDGTYRVYAVSKKGCIYPNLRAYLNQDKDRQNRFFRDMEGYPVREYMRGERQPKKNAIDLMLKITGMTYEELFKEEDYGEE